MHRASTISKLSGAGLDYKTIKHRTWKYSQLFGRGGRVGGGEAPDPAPFLDDGC